MDVIFWITIIGAVVGIPLAALQLIENLKKQRAAACVFRVDQETHYDWDKVIPHYRSDVPLSVSLKSQDATPASVHIQLNLVGLVDEEEIKLAPFLLIEQLKTEPLSGDSVACELLGKGDGGISRWFLVALSPERPPVFRSPVFNFHCGHIQLHDTPDFFRLRKGEREVFELHVMQIPGYRYEFKVGVPYSYKGKHRVEWLSDIFAVALIDGPTRVFEVRDDIDSAEEVHREMTEFRSHEYVRDALTRAEEKLKSIRGFEDCWANNGVHSKR